MKLSDHRRAKWTLLLSVSALLFLFVGGKQFAQTQTQMPKRIGQVNDFAGVVDEKSRLQLENVLVNVKQKTGIEFDVATVESTAGQDIFEYSRQLALDWNIGARGSKQKSLLLVVSVSEKTSFTQFSRSVQDELPEGVLGEMGQRMRTLVSAGQFSDGLNAAVQYFVNSMAQKLGLSANDFDKAPSVVSNTAPVETVNSSSKSTDETGPAVSNPVANPPASEPLRATSRTASPRIENTSRARRAAAPIDDEAESEEVELTLTKPLEERVVKLKAFLDSHPDSKSRVRATELLVSAYAALGDDKLKKGDSAGGIDQLLLAIAAAPVNASEKLFSGVISQIPLNLYLRGEPAAATRAAQNIETKFGGDPKRLLALSGFYVATEQGAEAVRLATQVVGLAPDMAEAHQALGRALHISLRLEEAAAEYKRALELDPNSKSSQRSVADLNRAFGKTEEALTLYRQQLVAEPSDRAARAGLVLSLLDLGRTDEAKTELEKAIQTDPRNLILFAGAAYWFAAHNEPELALELGRKAVQLEPRYTWSQVALARALVAQKRPLEAERALRFARQYGKFPTLDYELASALAAAGLYDEASEILMQSFSIKDGQIASRLAGRTSASASNFIDLLATERRASIFQSASADSEDNAKTLKALLTFATALNQENGSEAINEESVIAAAKEFVSGDDAARVYRQLYAASRLLQKGIGFQTVYELAQAARNSAEDGLGVAAVTVAVQADELREIRARAISSGGTPDIPDAPRNVLSNLLRGRIEDLSGWARFNQDKLDEAVDHLKRAVNVLPDGTPALRASLWHLGATLERQDKKPEALTYYIKSYNSGGPDPVRRAVIEQLYRKINGSLDGLEERIGPAAAMAEAQTPTRVDTATDATTAAPPPVASPESVPTSTPTLTANPAEASATPASSPAAEGPAVAPATRSPETSATPTAEHAAEPTSSPASSPEATPTPTPTPEAPAVTTPTPEVASMQSVAKPLSVVTIKGRVKDANNSPLANVVVVLISPQGTVLAATTDDEGNFSFTVAPSTHSYRLIPSRDGFTFEPVDRVLLSVLDDQQEVDFIGRRL